MLHPSYSDLMNIANSEVEQGEQPVVNSRYSIVLATAKRARQIIAGSAPLAKIHPVPNLCRLQLKNWYPVLSKLMQKKRKTTKITVYKDCQPELAGFFLFFLTNTCSNDILQTDVR